MSDNYPLPNFSGTAEDWRFLQSLCRHLIAMCWVTSDVGFEGEERGEKQIVCATTIAITLNQNTYLVTAGHIVNFIRKTVADASKKIIASTLFNDWSTIQQEARSPLPIDFYKSKSYAKYDRGEGVDFGMILIDDAQASILSERGMVPFAENRIGVPAGRAIEQIWLLGIPTELQVPCTMTNEVEIEPNLFRVIERERPHCFFETDVNRVYATVPQEVTLKELDGMSGGPLFAFTLDNGNLEDYVYGIQSGWNAEERVIRRVDKL